LRKTLISTSDTASGRSVRRKSRTSSTLFVVRMGVWTKYFPVGQSPTADGCWEGIVVSIGDDDGFSEFLDGAEDGGKETGEEVVNEDGSDVGLELGG
jgi:hypothetical protein